MSLFPPVNSPSDRLIWFLVIAAEAIYLLLTRWSFTGDVLYSAEGELLRSLARLAVFLVLWLWLRPIIVARPLERDQARHPLLWLSLAVFLSVPLLIGHMGNIDRVVNLVFAATSIVVGMHEELVFRAILQNHLLRHLRQWQAIGLSTVIFTVWHIGAMDPLFSLYAQVVLASLILGIIYAKTQSLWLVVALHALYDALFSLTGEFPVIPYRWGVVLLAVATVGIAWWGRATWLAGKRR